MHSGLSTSNHSPAVFSVESISQLRGRRNCLHCYLNFGWLSVFLLQFVSFSIIAFLHCCRLLSFSAFLIPFYITGKAFVSLLLFCIFYDVCVAIYFFAYATKRRGSAVSSFPFALIIIGGTVLIFLYLFLIFLPLPVSSLSNICLYLYPEVV